MRSTWRASSFGADYVAENPVLYCVSNTNAPLVMDAHMSGSLKVNARAGQPVACTPWVLTGAMSPCTVAGTLAQVLAETMAAMTLTQLINPGAPCLMGSFASTMSMQSGAPTFGTPEAGQMVLAAGQLARRLGVPLHTVGHAVCFETARCAKPARGHLGVDDGAIRRGQRHQPRHRLARRRAGDRVRENHYRRRSLRQAVPVFRRHRPERKRPGHGGHRQHRAGRAFSGLGPYASQLPYRALSARKLPDNDSFEQWAAGGEMDTAERANAIWKDRLEAYEDPGLDPAIDEELRDYIARRKAEVPDQEYF